MAAAIPVPAPGQYAVQLFFSELYFQSAGQRVFDLDIAGLPALSCFDIFYAAGGPDRGIVATFLVRPGLDAGGMMHAAMVLGHACPLWHAVELAFALMSSPCPPELVVCVTLN